MAQVKNILYENSLFLREKYNPQVEINSFLNVFYVKLGQDFY